MSARITKAEVAFLFPTARNDAADRNEALRLAGARAHQAAVMATLHRLVARVAGWPARARARAELAAMDGRELMDLGLTRGEIDAAIEGKRS
jgi:uncharacterized protein YjiS (DUF1127 family)